MDRGSIQRTSSPEALPGTSSDKIPGPKAQSSHRRRRSTATQQNRFHYKPLDRSKGAVRLIKVFPLRQNDFIRCRIERHHISTVQYVALSYVWGSQEARCEILLNGQIFVVRPNLYAFLKHLAKTGYFTDTLFWIDAMCIDQSNITEKNHHISHMGTIYSQASKVISWLGNSAYHTLSGKEPPGPWLCCEKVVQDRDSRRRHRCDWRVPYASSWNLLRHEYWNRLWVAQELSLAKQVDILWRGRFYSWSQIIKCLSKNALGVQEDRQRVMPLSKAFTVNANYVATLPVSRYLKSTQSAPLGNLVPQFASHECQVGHDHAFALLSMASDGQNFEPDYGEQSISLLLRLMTFCYTSPTAAFTNKIGTALGLDPRTKGIAVNLIGHPSSSETTESSATYFRLVDQLPGRFEPTDLLAQIPDTNLHILFHKKSSNNTETTYTALARVNAVSARVERGRQKFASVGKKKAIDPSSNIALSESPTWLNAILKKESKTNSLRLHCDWQTVLSIFDLSRTQSMPGRLESRIREWVLPGDLPLEQCERFVVS